MNCSYNTRTDYCYYRDDAAVICRGKLAGDISTTELQTLLSAVDPITFDCLDGDIRLVGGSTALEGGIEVCFNNAWGAVCDYRFNAEEASVACSQLGFQRAGKC